MKYKFELSQKAFVNVSQFKDHCYPGQFEKITEAIEGHDNNMGGSSFPSMQAAMKLKAIAELDLPNFIETLKYIN